MSKKLFNKSNKCPICDGDVAKKFLPFCSVRCSDVDLGRWLKGMYVIPSDEVIPDTGFDDE